MSIMLAAVELAQKIRTIPTIEAAILFGSAAKGEMHKKSDIDILLIFNTDHNPEIGEEGKIVHEYAGEIEEIYKLENPFSFVFINKGEHVDSDFLWEVAKNGIVLYCRPERMVGKETYMKPALVVSYRFPSIPQKDKMFIKRRLYGYMVRKIYKGKEYISKKEGLVNQYGKKIGKAVFLIDAKKSDEITKLFDSKNVMYSVTKIWI